MNKLYSIGVFVYHSRVVVITGFDFFRFFVSLLDLFLCNRRWLWLIYGALRNEVHHLVCKYFIVILDTPLKQRI